MVPACLISLLLWLLGIFTPCVLKAELRQTQVLCMMHTIGADMLWRLLQSSMPSAFCCCLALVRAPWKGCCSACAICCVVSRVSRRARRALRGLQG